MINVQLRGRIDSLLREAAQKDDILGLVSHEIRTPLTLIVGVAEAIRTGRFHDRAAQDTALEEISSAGRRVADMASNMLALVQHERGGPPPEPLLLQRLLGPITARHLHVCPDSEVRLSVPGDLPPVLGVASYIEQIVGNLLSNANKYGHPGQPIDLTAEVHGRFVGVTVASSGEVLNPENIDRLFLAFHREPKVSQVAPGLGLGLAVCRLLARAQQGSIFATARPLGGLKVTVTLNVIGD